MNETDTRLECAGYWDDADDHPIEDWQYEIMNNDTRLGYHDWLTKKREEEQWDKKKEKEL